MPEGKRKPNGKYPVYGANGVIGRTNEYYYDKQSVIVGRKGSAGEINLAEKRFWPLDVTYFVTFDQKKYDLKFIYHLLENQDLPRLAKGVKPGINRNEVYAIAVKVPPLSEQRRIVAKLDKAFAAVAKAKENAEKNLANSKELFESYLNGVFAKPGKGWEEKKLGEVCEYYNGKAHEKIINNNGKYIVINSKFISSEGKVFKKTNTALFQLTKGDITMVLSDVPKGKALAKCYLVEKDNTFSLNQRICAIRSNKFYPKYLYYQLNRNKHFLTLDNGENQTNLRLSQILSCPLCLPALKEQRNTVMKIDVFLEQTKKLEAIYTQKLADLVELKKSVLQMALNGEL